MRPVRKVSSLNLGKIIRIRPREINTYTFQIDKKGIEYGHKLYLRWEKHFGKAVSLLGNISRSPSLAGKNKVAFLEIFPESIRRNIIESRRFERLGKFEHEKGFNGAIKGLIHLSDLMVGPADSVCGFIGRLGEFSRKWKNTPKGNFEKVFELFALNHPEGPVRISALLELEKLAGNKAEPVFEKSLMDPDYKVRRNTMQILSRLKSFSVLKKAWSKEKNHFLKQEAFNLLDANNKEL